MKSPSSLSIIFCRTSVAGGLSCFPAVMAEQLKGGENAKRFLALGSSLSSQGNLRGGSVKQSILMCSQSYKREQRTITTAKLACAFHTVQAPLPRVQPHLQLIGRFPYQSTVPDNYAQSPVCQVILEFVSTTINTITQVKC